MSRCLCLKKDGKQCMLASTKKFGNDPRFCHLHQKCSDKSIIMNHNQGSPLKTQPQIAVNVNKLKIPLKTQPQITVDVNKLKIPIPLKTQPQIAIDVKKIEKTKGKIFVGQKRRRGIKGDKDASRENTKNIDVTSGSFNKLGEYSATTLSPMYIGPVKDNDGLICKIFENYWQYSKLWKTAGHILPGTQCEPTATWISFRAGGFEEKKGKRHPLPTKKYGYATCSIYNNKVYDYISSRKAIYVPVYKSLVEKLPIIGEMKKILDSGQNIMIIDGDGPDKKKYPNGLEMTQKNWDEMINDKAPFGHGYVVAGILAGFI